MGSPCGGKIHAYRVYFVPPRTASTMIAGQPMDGTYWESFADGGTYGLDGLSTDWWRMDTRNRQGL